VPGDDDDRQSKALGPQTLLNLEAAQVGHSHVDDEARVVLRAKGAEKRLSGSKRLHPIACSLEEKTKRIADGLVVIRNVA
jgi:hypothetical protein